MAIARPPQHRVDAQPCVILEIDEAWNVDKINAEMEVLGDVKSLHPYVRYHAGASRFDLGAEFDMPDGTTATIADYVDIGKAWRFYGRRLEWDEVYRIQPLMRSNPELAHAEALALSLVRVDGPDAPKIAHENGRLSEASITALFEISVRIPLDVGRALLIASLPMTASEKKP